MGRRPVRRAALPGDGAANEGAVRLPNPGLGTPSQGLAGVGAAVTAKHDLVERGEGKDTLASGATREGEGKKSKNNPLMGLVHYGSDSDDDPAPAAAAAAAASTTAMTSPSEDSNLDLGFSAVSARASAPVSSSTTPLSSPDETEGSTITYVTPSGWQQCMDGAGQVYFWNTESGETTWDPPEGTEIRRMTPSRAAVAASSEERGVASDATSDTASEAEEDLAQKSKEVPPEAEAEENNGADDGTTPSLPVSLTSKMEEDTELKEEERRNAGDGVGTHEKFGRGSAERSGRRKRSPSPASAGNHVPRGAAGREGAEDRQVPRQQRETTTTSSDVSDGAAGVDDLLAGIEAELLNGSDAGDQDGKSNGGSCGEKNTEEGMGGEKGVDKEDFSSLGLVEPGLDQRARQAHSELSALLLLAAAEKQDGNEEGRVGRVRDDGALRLSIELGAVLRARLSDWREGGLHGLFLVRKLDEMAARARSSLGHLRPASPTKTASSQAATDGSKDVNPGAGISVTREPLGERNTEDTTSATEAASDSDQDVVLKGRQRRVHGGTTEATPVVDGRLADGGRQRGTAEGVGDDRLKKTVVRDADAESRAKSLRAEKNAQQLKWADEVSAAAAAAVAAAAALSQAKKDQAKAESRAKAAAASKQQRSSSRKSKLSRASGGRGGVGGVSSLRARAEAGGSPSSDDGKLSASKAAVSTLPDSARTGDEETIDPQVVGDDDDDKEDGEMSGSEVASKLEGGEDGAAPKMVVDTSESGIVIARDPAATDLPRGWSAVFDTTHQAYYYHNLATDETTWVLPAAEKEAGPATPSLSTSRSSPEPGESRVSEKKSPVIKDRDSSSGGSGRGATSRARTDSQHRKGSREEKGADRADPSAVAAAQGDRGKGVESKAANESGDVDAGSGARSPSSPTHASGEMDVAVAGAEAKETDPASMTESLPSGWAEIWDDNQQAFYYHNTATDETSWERPPSARAAPALDATANKVSSSPVPSSLDKGEKKVNQQRGPSADAAEPDGAQSRSSATPASVDPSTTAAAPDDAKSVREERRSPSPMRDSNGIEPTASKVDLRPCTLVWWSDAGDVWNGAALSGLLGGYGPRRYRNLGGGYYMTTLESGPEWATAAVAALGQGVADPVAAAHVDWVSCTASAPGYGLFVRFSGDDDEQKLFDVPDEFFDDPPPDPAVVAAEEAAAAAFAARTEAASAAAAARAAAVAEEEAAQEDAEMDAAAAAAVAATKEAEAAGTEVAAAVLAAPSAPTSSSATSKKRKSKGSSSAGKSGGSIGKKRKGAANLIDKWKAVASTAGEEAQKEAEKQEKMERWKARMAALDPTNPNFTPIGKKRR